MRSGAPFGPEWVISRSRDDVRAESGQPSTTDLERTAARGSASFAGRGLTSATRS
jgi:hypothetical protein